MFEAHMGGFWNLLRGMSTRACKGVFKAPVCSETEECLGAVFFLLARAYRQLPGHLTGSLRGALTGHELVGANFW